MKSLHTRLDGHKAQVLKVTETFGRFRAMTEFKITDYGCFCKWLGEVTNDENFGLRPKISLEGGQTLADQLVGAFLRKVAAMETEREKLRTRIKFLEWQLDQTGEKEQNQALAVLEVCRV